MNKKLLLAIAILFPAIYTFAASTQSGVENYVKKLVTDSIAILEDDKLESNKKTQKIKNTLRDNLDIKWMAKFTLGRNIKSLSQKDIDNFITTYSEYLLSTYAKGLKKYSGQKVEIKSYDDLGNGFYLVKTNIIGQTDQPIHVDYLTRSINGSYKVRDIVTEGISLVNSQRSEYSGTIENHGIEYLMSELKKRSSDKADDKKLGK